MAAGTLIPVEDYLNTTYRPDCDYVDGEVLERNVGERSHSRMQREILVYLSNHYPELRELILPEQRVQVRVDRFRVPDVCVIAANAPDEQILRTPPILCIEILSPEDTMTRTMQRIEDFFHMGVPICWIIDPADRKAWHAFPGHLDQALDGILRAGEISMPLTEVLS